MRTLFAAALLLLALASSAAAGDPTCFELRTYHAAPGKATALHARFRDHTVALFQKHGMTNVLYSIPREDSGVAEKNTLVYLLAYPDRDAREASWKTFREDPEWIAVKAASEKDGKLVTRVDSLFLHPTDYSPALPAASASDKKPGIFEMRHYTARPGKLAALDARFRDHTIALLTKHGMTQLPYFHLDEGQDHSEVTLIYFLAHDSAEARTESFAAFRKDPDWIAVRDASEKDGKLVIENGVVSTLLDPTDYSPIK
ncbi:MAG: NIPSNAP family protein [Verrucomicrobiaceae bacterium]|nr:NIPSNAP family protein [Verrucomicrobiaceae bacterium]